MSGAKGPSSHFTGPPGKSRPPVHARLAVLSAWQSRPACGHGNGVLAIEQLQPAGKKPMHVADFLNGQKLVTGQMLAASTA